jgi:hypothetical protein
MISYIGAPWQVIIDDATVTTAKLAADAVTGAAIADNAIDSEHYTDGSIDLAHMSVNSIDSDQYVDGSIDLAHMSVNSVDSDQYVDGSIDYAHIQNVAANSLLGRNANSSGVLTEIALATTQILIGDGTGFTVAALSGDVTMSNAGAVTIANDAVEEAMIADDAVGSVQLKTLSTLLIKDSAGSTLKTLYGAGA